MDLTNFFVGMAFLFGALAWAVVAAGFGVCVWSDILGTPLCSFMN